jgi:hypothetical protein
VNDRAVVAVVVFDGTDRDLWNENHSVNMAITGSSFRTIQSLLNKILPLNG